MDFWRFRILVVLLCLCVFSGCGFSAGFFSRSSSEDSGDEILPGSSLFLALGYVSELSDDEQSSTESDKLLTRLTGINDFSVPQSGNHICAIDSQGDAFCWGANEYGQLGDGTNAASNLPVKVSSTKNFVQITSGGYRSCALDDQGEVFCWGYAANNALGNSSNTNQSSPVQVILPVTAKLIRSGYMGSCAIGTDDKIYCWGQNYPAPPIAELWSPGTLVSLHPGHGDVMCGLTSAGEAYCWGRNNGGQLGVGDTADRNIATAVLGGLFFADITAAYNDITCGLTLDHKLYCWGGSVMGVSQQTSPLLVNASVNMSKFYFSGGGRVCGFGVDGISRICVSTQDGTITTSSTDYSFVKVDAGCGLTSDHLLVCRGDVASSGSGIGLMNGNPLAYSWLNDFDAEKIYSGSYEHCLQKQGDRKVYCWGYNDSGALGFGDQNERLAPVLAAGGKEFKSIAGGEEYLCGIDLNDEIFCAGANWAGTLGDGTTTANSVFIPALGGLKFGSVSAGQQHTCGVSLVGAAYCWGINGSGAVGDGTSTDRTAPTAVTGGHTFLKVLTSTYSTCGLKADGSVYCWGYNGDGELGDGTTNNSLVPVKVDTSVVLQDIVMGGWHSCGLDADGQAYCWGGNWDGQLGDGTVTDRSSPVAVQTSLRFRKLVAFHLWMGLTCGIEEQTSRVYCWGESYNETAFSSSTTPVLVSETVASDLMITSDNLIIKSSGEPFIRNFSLSGPLFFSSATVTLQTDIKNSYGSYCILENSTDENACIWKTGSVPSSYQLQNSGFVRLTLFVRQGAGGTPVHTQSPLYFKM